jgi:hypothetical protein
VDPAPTRPASRYTALVEQPELFLQARDTLGVPSLRVAVACEGLWSLDNMDAVQDWSHLFIYLYISFRPTRRIHV